LDGELLNIELSEVQEKDSNISVEEVIFLEFNAEFSLVINVNGGPKKPDFYVLVVLGDPGTFGEGSRVQGFPVALELPSYLNFLSEGAHFKGQVVLRILVSEDQSIFPGSFGFGLKTDSEQAIGTEVLIADHQGAEGAEWFKRPVL